MTTTTNGGPPLRELPLGDLIGRFRAQFGQLASEEAGLLRAEMNEKKRRAVNASALGGAALVLALCGIGALVAFAILVLDLVMPAWAAALIVAVVILAGAALAAVAARAQLRRAGSPVPQRTIQSVKEDVGWLTQRARQGIG